MMKPCGGTTASIVVSILIALGGACFIAPSSVFGTTELRFYVGLGFIGCALLFPTCFYWFPHFVNSRIEKDRRERYSGAGENAADDSSDNRKGVPEGHVIKRKVTTEEETLVAEDKAPERNPRGE